MYIFELGTAISFRIKNTKLWCKLAIIDFGDKIWSCYSHLQEGKIAISKERLGARFSNACFFPQKFTKFVGISKLSTNLSLSRFWTKSKIFTFRNWQSYLSSHLEKSNGLVKRPGLTATTLLKTFRNSKFEHIFQFLIIFVKNCILNVWESSEYAFEQQ